MNPYEVNQEKGCVVLGGRSGNRERNVLEIIIIIIIFYLFR